MKIPTKKSAAALLAILISMSVNKTLADEIITTRTTTTTVPTYSLPAGQTFIVVDPLTGNVKGVLDPNARLVNGQPLTAGLVISDKISGQIRAVVDASGNIVDITAAPAPTSLLAAIEARRDQLNQILTDALASGTLSAEQARTWQNELDNLVAAEVIAKQNGAVLTYSQVLPMAYKLNVFSDRLVPIVKTTVVPAPVITERIITTGNQIVISDDITYRRLKMGALVDDEYNVGHLSNRQVADLKDRLNKVAASQSRYMKDGALNNNEQSKLSHQLDLVQAKFDSDKSVINAKRTQIGIRAD